MELFDGIVVIVSCGSVTSRHWVNLNMLRMFRCSRVSLYLCQPAKHALPAHASICLPDADKDKSSHLSKPGPGLISDSQTEPSAGSTKVLDMDSKA